MKKSRIALFLVALLVLGLTTVGFAADPKYGGTYRTGMMSNPPTLDPVQATDTSSAEVLYQIVETLVTYTPDGEVMPQLAESWDISDDGLVYTFHLRDDVTFHATAEGEPTANGGRKVTAHDWVWTFNYICGPSNSPRAYFIDMVKGYQEYRDGKTDSISGIKALDDYTLQIEITYPFAPFISVLAYQTFSVIPKEDVEKWGDQFAYHPVGTGPFTFFEWVQDSKVVLKRNPNYWDTDENGNQLPYLDEVVVQIIPEATMRWEEFQMGNLEKTDVDDPYYLEAKEK
ncbi:MAG: ABC transporter substrate-binding protein, partial [Halanaerobium sp.]|nr:ABC transporter substrate-binding protein [Halanaerobium sp.]